MKHEPLLRVGDFVRVGSDVGVVVGLSDGVEVPEEHLAVWYGEVGEAADVPRCRTVPAEYCEVVSTVEYYH